MKSILRFIPGLLGLPFYSEVQKNKKHFKMRNWSWGFLKDRQWVGCSKSGWGRDERSRAGLKHVQHVRPNKSPHTLVFETLQYNTIPIRASRASMLIQHFL